MKLRCVCDQDYVYDHTKAGTQFNCSWCKQLIVMPHFESLSPEDQAFYRNELQKRKEKAKRAAEKAERKQRLAAEKEAERQQLTQQEVTMRKRLEEQAQAQQAIESEKEKQYADALAHAKSEPDKAKVWFCSIKQVQHGPMQEAMVQKWIDNGTSSNVDYVRTENSVIWLRLSDLPERFYFPSISAPQRESRMEERTISAPRKESGTGERILYEAHPSMFRNRPVGFVISIVLIPVLGLGLIILLIWWLKCFSTTFTVTNERITLRKGILSKYTNEVYHTDVRNVRINQSLFQRIFGVGAIDISTAGSGGVEIAVGGMPNPGEVKNIIDQHRR